MTQTELAAGRGLDVLVAEEVMGWVGIGHGALIGTNCGEPIPYGFDPARNGYATVPRYSTDIAAAWTVVEKIPMTVYAPHAPYASDEYQNGDEWSAEASEGSRRDANTAPLAICLAALAFVGACGRCGARSHATAECRNVG